MPDLEVLGVDTGVEKSKLPLLIGLGALAIGLLIFRRPGGSSSPSGGGGSDAAAAAEFARVTSAAAGDMQRLTATNNLRRYELDLAQANTPAGLRECITGEQWKQMPKDARSAILSQAKRSGSLVTPGAGGGVCIVPTDRGLGGDLQSVQRSKGGLFSSSSSGIGAPAPAVPRLGILDALDAWFRSQAYGGYGGF